MKHSPPYITWGLPMQPCWIQWSKTSPSNYTHKLGGPPYVWTNPKCPCTIPVYGFPAPARHVLWLQPPGFWDFPSLSTIFPKKKTSLHYSPGETSLIPISLVPARLTQQLLSLQQAGLALAGSNRRSRSSQVWDSDRGDRGDHAVNSVDRFQTVVGINLVYPWIYLHIYVYVLYIDIYIYIWLSQLIGVISIYFHVYRCIHEEALACTQKVGIDEDTSSTMRVLHGYKQ